MSWLWRHRTKAEIAQHTAVCDTMLEEAVKATEEVSELARALIVKANGAYERSRAERMKVSAKKPEDGGAERPTVKPEKE